MVESCLVQRLERFVALTSSEKDFIAFMEREEQTRAKRDAVVDIGDSVEHLFVLKYGWAIARDREINGRSPIFRIYLPGEVIGLADIATKQARHQIVMVTDGAVCPFPRAALPDMFSKAPRLASLLLALSGLDQIMLRERLSSISRRSPADRLVEFLLFLRDRLRVANADTGNRVHLPVTQVQIADILGVTNVHLNKVLRTLKDEGLISVSKDQVRLLETAQLEDRVGYRNLYSDIDQSWFPQVD